AGRRAGRAAGNLPRLERTSHLRSFSSALAILSPRPARRSGAHRRRARLNTMSAPGGGFGEGDRRDDWTPPWDPPAADYPPAYSPPGYPPGYPAEYPPPMPPPPGYGQPPGYGALPYPPGGYGPPPYPGGYPGGYYPTPDYQPALQSGTNGLAIASLVSSFTGFLCCFIGSILAIVLGVVALNQIKQTRQEGYGLAVTGIVIGAGTLVVLMIIALFSIIPVNSH